MTSEHKISQWPRKTLKVFGFLHIVFAAVGLYVVVATVGLYISTDSFTKPGEIAYLDEVFLVRSVINAIFLAAELVAGILLIRAELSGVRISNILFGTMIAYILVPLWDLFGPAIARSMAATFGTGNMGLSFHLITGYPIIALIGLNLARRKLRKDQETDTSVSD